MGYLGKRAIAPLAALLAIIVLAGLAPAARAEGTRVIAVTGEGRVTVRPDTAWITLGVSHEAETAEEALDGMSLALGAVLERLLAEGIAEADIRTSQLRLDPRYDQSSISGRNRLTGYLARSDLEVRVRDLARVGEVLDLVVADGANQLSGIRFDLSDRSEALAEARQAAVADGAARAALYAAAGGVALGELVQLTDTGANIPIPGLDLRMAMESSAVPVASGEMEIFASVTMVYAIAEE